MIKVQDNKITISKGDNAVVRLRLMKDGCADGWRARDLEAADADGARKISYFYNAVLLGLKCTGCLRL